MKTNELTRIEVHNIIFCFFLRALRVQLPLFQRKPLLQIRRMGFRLETN